MTHHISGMFIFYMSVCDLNRVIASSTWHESLSVLAQFPHCVGWHQQAVTFLSNLPLGIVSSQQSVFVEDNEWRLIAKTMPGQANSSWNMLDYDNECKLYEFVIYTIFMGMLIVEESLATASLSSYSGRTILRHQRRFSSNIWRSSTQRFCWL